MDKLFHLGLSISYDRVLQISADLGNAVNQFYRMENVVCPPRFCQTVFSTGAVDNIDVDPSSTTASSSFHGTGISLFQHPSVPAEGIDCERIILGGVSGMKTVGRLPNYYTDVPPVTASKKGSAIPCTGLSSLEAKLEHGELQWLESVREVIEMEEENDDYKDISWSAFHAQRQSTQQYPSTSSALLPLFHESATTVAMIRHAMDVVN